MLTCIVNDFCLTDTCCASSNIRLRLVVRPIFLILFAWPVLESIFSCSWLFRRAHPCCVWPFQLSCCLLTMVPVNDDCLHTGLHAPGFFSMRAPFASGLFGCPAFFSLCRHVFRQPCVFLFPPCLPIRIACRLLFAGCTWTRQETLWLHHAPRSCHMSSWILEIFSLNLLKLH